MDPATILLVDDDVEFVDSVNTCLNHAYKVISAYTAEQAFEAIRESKPDLVLLDVMLPDTSGIFVLSKIKDTAPSLPVIIMTGFSTEDVAIQALRRRADDYVRKGDSIEDLISRIEGLLPRKDHATASCADRLLEKTSNPHVQRAIQWASERFLDDVRLPQMAHAVGLSTKYLSRLFVRETGIRPMQFVTQLRIERAKHLLESTNTSVNKIALQAGFHYPAHFRRTFRKFQGCTPNECRTASRDTQPA